ncbi:MAG TPA: MarR family transcriptional regulator [Nitrososphaerales archaeon]|nr:MarR family transcriptional regulator [Nitrososphaerales archaeon]
MVILKAIGDDVAAQNLSFQGIRRKLGLHQETLSRALHRLQRDGYVERLEHAYRISQKGLTVTQTQPRLRGGLEGSDPYSVTLLQAVLPQDLNVNALVDSLSYKWFGNLRWLGSTQSPNSSTLSWMTSETGLKISVRIKDDALSIETYPRDSNSISDATRSAFELFDHVSRALKSSDRVSEARFSNAS